MSLAVVAQGVGVDLVHVPSFAAQLAEPGSVFPRVFTDREWSYCASLPSGIDEGGARPSRQDASLAARWAAKEAVIKAWSGLLYGHPPQVAPDSVDWAQIEVTPDRWGRPGLTFHGQIRDALDELAVELGGGASRGGAVDSGAAGSGGTGSAAATSTKDLAGGTRAAGVHLEWSLSLSHDHDQAIAFVTVTAVRPIEPAASDRTLDLLSLPTRTPSAVPDQGAGPVSPETSSPVSVSHPDPTSTHDPTSSQDANTTWPT